tara:strand:- start:2071 stop:3633 length:1563 start_codon:yes stop_codon:yes gene_type:complete
MAVKFSDFTTETNEASVTALVGYISSSNTNIQIDPSNLDTTYSLEASASGSNVVLTLDGTKPGGTATDDTITITQGSGISFSSITAAGFEIAATGAVTTVDAGTPTASSGTPLSVSPTTGDVKVIAHSYNGTTNVGYVPTGGSSSTFLRGDGAWVTPAGSFTGFDITDGATTETVGAGDTITFQGGTNITTTVSATDTVSIAVSGDVWTLAGGNQAGTSQGIQAGQTALITENTATVVNSVQVGGGVQTTAANTDQLLLDQTAELVVTMVNPGSGNLLYIDGAYQSVIELAPGFTYEFNQDDISNSGHPIEIGEVLDGSTPYATGIKYYGSSSANTLTEVTQSNYQTNSSTYSSGTGTARVRLRVTQNSPTLYYYCSNHGGMGGAIGYGGDTYTLQAGTKAGTSVPLQLDATSGTDSTVNLTEGAGITLTQTSATEITIESAAGVTVTKEQFTGNNSTTVFTLATSTTTDNINIFISGVYQNSKDSSGVANYAVTSGTTLTFITAPPTTATNGIEVVITQ